MSHSNHLRSVAMPALALLALVLSACGGPGANGDWYYHFACNGDFQCLATNPIGQPFGTLDEGPVESSCTSLQANAWGPLGWGSAAWDACDHSPTFTPPGYGTPTITGLSRTSGAPGTQVTVTGTDFPPNAGAGQVTWEIGGVSIPTTAGFATTATTITFTIPSVASVSGPITVHTPGGQATSSATFTILDNLSAVAWSGTRFLAVGDYGTALTSTDGVHWTPRTTGANPLLVSLASAAWTGNQFVAGGSNGYLLTSPDGIGWTLPSGGLGMMTFTGIATSGTELVAAGSQAAIATSTTGASWTAKTNSPADFYNAIAWTGSQFVVAGFAILTSPDGGTWTTRVAQGTPYQGLAWSGTTLVAVGAGGAVLTSPDGVTWTPRTSGTVANLRGVTWFKDKFVAVGAGGVVVTSPNGITWTARDAGVSGTLNGVAASGTTVVAVGSAGLTISSSDGISWSSLLPAPPTGVLGTHEPTQSSISWSPAADATSYVVYASTSGTVSKTVYAKRVATAASPALLTGLSSGWWYVVVTSVNGFGEGPPSAVASVCVGMYICGP